MKAKTAKMSKRQAAKERKARVARKLELKQLLGGSKSLRGYSGLTDHSRLVKVILHNGESFWDYPTRTTDQAYEFHKAGIIPREMIKKLFFWRKPSDKQQFMAALHQNDKPHFSTQGWMDELKGSKQLPTDQNERSLTSFPENNAPTENR